MARSSRVRRPQSASDTALDDGARHAAAKPVRGDGPIRAQGGSIVADAIGFAEARATLLTTENRAGAEWREPIQAVAATAGDLAAANENPAGATPNRRHRDVSLALSLRGYVDEAHAHRISGWVWCPERPGHRVELELLDGDNPLLRVAADRHRPDLRAAGIGDGRHAFAIPLSALPLSLARHTLHVRCAETGAELPGSPIVLERSQAAVSRGQGFSEAVVPYVPAPIAAIGRPRPPGGEFGQEVLSAEPIDHIHPEPHGRTAAETTWPMPASSGGRSMECHIDRADRGGIVGWIWEPRRPLERVVLELLDGDALVTTVAADEYRQDLEEAGIGDGRHAFSITFGETVFPNARHTLHLRPVGSENDLPSFPLELSREGAGLDGTVQFILGNFVAEAERAKKKEDLAPVIEALVTMLDGVMSRYFEIAEDEGEGPADRLNPRELAPQFQALLKSIQTTYSPINLDLDGEPLVSIVIPVFNKFGLTYDCVKSVVEHGAGVPFEIVIVDDCSRDETLLASLAFGKGIRLVRNSVNSGFIHSCNNGFDVAGGEYVVFLNNDTVVKPGWLDELYETFQRDPKIGVAGSKLLFADGVLQECGGIIWRLGDGWNWGRGQDAADPRFNYLRDCDYVSGAALMIKSSLFAELGKFDEHFAPAYYEDTDLCFRVRQAGYRVVVQPASEVVHLEGASAGTSVTGTGMKRFQAINHRKFRERWKDVLADHRFNGELPELEAERGVRQRALFIDDSVPQPDKDAGSNAAFQHIQSLQRLGYKVTFVPGDNMARIDPYTRELERRGVECLHHPFYFSVEDVFRKKTVSFDLVYLHRYSNASKYAGMIRQHFPQARILYNVADLHFLRLQREAEVRNEPGLHEKAAQMRRLELGAMAFVDCVVVHSAVEAALLREMAPHIAVEIVPWTVTPREVARTAMKKSAIAFVGGYGHPPNVDAAKWAAQNLMPTLRRQISGIELLLVGSNMPNAVSALAAKDIVPLGFVPSLDSVFERVRLTVAPLRYGAGVKGKVLESLAAGIPCVMTSVAAEGIELPDELRLLVADDAETMAKRIALLCRDDGEYRRVAAAGKALIAAQYRPERVDALIGRACSGD